MLQIGISGHELTARERDWLQHDGCAGVVLLCRAAKVAQASCSSFSL